LRWEGSSVTPLEETDAVSDNDTAEDNESRGVQSGDA
jgi:hypothetical protein